jgi:hypothetical protein
MFLTIQPLVNGTPSGLKREVHFQQGGLLMQSELDLIGDGQVRRSLSNKPLVVPRTASEKKYAFTITGAGWQPPGLDDFQGWTPVQVGCIQPLSQQSSGGPITPIRNARSDVNKTALALVPGQGLVKTTLSGWTPAAVTGATKYYISFYPLLDGLARYRGALDQATGQFRWTLEFLEK